MTETTPRLAPGHHLYPGEDGLWRCMMPDDAVLHIRGTRHLMMSRLQQVLHGWVQLEKACPDEASRTALIRLVCAFARRGLLATSSGPSTNGDECHQHRVLVEGDNPVGRLAADMLAGHSNVTIGPANIAAVDHSEFVVSVAGWLPDAHWQQVDSWCTQRHIPFHRCHIEGTFFVIGPCSVPGATATYADTRARRLAAANAPEELEEHWKYLDSGQVLPAAPWPHLGGVAIIAGILVADILAYLSGQPPPSRGYQLEVDLGTLTVVRHPVLPLPDVSGTATVGCDRQ